MEKFPARKIRRGELPSVPSLPWRKISGRGSSPWLAVDPGLQSECSAAYRAFRLVMLALFALIGASAHAQSESNAVTVGSVPQAGFDCPQREIEEFETLVERQAQPLPSQQQRRKFIDRMRQPKDSAAPAVAHSVSAHRDRRESAHLKVNRTHAPPQANNPLSEVASRVGQPSPHLLVPVQRSRNTLDGYFFFSSSQSRSLAPFQMASAAPPVSEVPPAVAPRADVSGIPPSPASTGDTVPSSPLQFRLGNAYFTPVGFVDFTSVWRNHDTGNGIATSFGSIPYGNTVQTNLSELRFSSQYSRIGFRLDALVKQTHLMGYMEADFLGSAPGNLTVSTNSNPLRMRLYWVDLRGQHWKVLAGQTWSLITPNRKGISPLPGNVFYTQNIDADYQAGLFWARVPEFRFVWHFNDKAALAAAVDSPEQYMGGSGGGGKITLPPVLEPIYAGGELNDGSSGTHTPNTMPDIVAKLALDPSRRFHIEAGGVLRYFRLYNPLTDAHFASTGGGGFLNLRWSVWNGLSVLTNNFWSDGGGRYIFGQVPDLIVRSDGSPSPIHSGSTVTGLEYKRSKLLLYAYYGGIYAQRNVAVDLNGKPIGYGYIGSPNSQNRTIQEGTAGLSRTVWKDARYGALNVLGQYSYVARSPWFVDTGQPPNAKVHMVFLTLRYTLPGSPPSMRY